MHSVLSLVETKNLFGRKQCPVPKFCFLSWAPQRVTLCDIVVEPTAGYSALCPGHLIAFVTKLIIPFFLADLCL